MKVEDSHWSSVNGHLKEMNTWTAMSLFFPMTNDY